MARLTLQRNLEKMRWQPSVICGVIDLCRPNPLAASRRMWIACCFALAILTGGTARACVGTACIEIWSTADGGGALTVYWDFNKIVQTYQSFCASDGSACLYTTIDPGFMAPDPPAPASGLYRITDGTKVNIVVVSADPGLTLEVNGQKLYQPGDTAQLGIQPPIHNHPSWQIVVPANQYGNFNLSYKLTTDSAAYTNSEVYTQVVTNIVPPVMTPTATPTAAPTPPACAGDCDSSGDVTIDELLTCVNIALGTAPLNSCVACDDNLDDEVTIDELIGAINNALSACPMTPQATLAEIQASILTPSCAIPTCHDAQSAAEDLVLTDGQSYGNIVNVPSQEVTSGAGTLRIDPGHPENSFLLIKVVGPPPGQGELMPLIGEPLTAQQIQLIRNWILQGANP